MMGMFGCSIPEHVLETVGAFCVKKSRAKDPRY
jgi:hypothetical protein